MPYRNPRRGVHAPHTNEQRLVRLDEIGAMELMNIGSISILDYHLNDARFVEYLRWAVQDGLEVYCRLMTGWNNVPDPAQWAGRTRLLAHRNEFVKAWIPCNEPNIEWPSMDWPAFNDWCKNYWWNVNYYREEVPITLLYPPLAQDMGGYLDHRTAYDYLQDSIGLYVGNGDGFSWHSYWNAGDMERLVEHEFPDWLRAIIEMPDILTLIHESGRKIDDAQGSGVEGPLGLETNTRFGSAHYGSPGTSVARAVTHWILGSAAHEFEHQAWIDELGQRRQIVYELAWWGA